MLPHLSHDNERKLALAFIIRLMTTNPAKLRRRTDIGGF